MPDEIIWEEPPPTALQAGQKPGRYKEFAEQLRRHPGRWAVLPGDKKSEASARATAQNIRGGRVQGMAKGEYETAVDGTKVFVRFIAKQEQEQAEEPATPTSPRLPQPERDGEAARARAWALQRGMEVPSAGRLSGQVLEAYRQALADDPTAGAAQ